ncbi:hypothetical protein JQC81_28975 [Microvirga arabica]|nr:hypothetical protein [Microvirga arabica]
MRFCLGAQPSLLGFPLRGSAKTEVGPGAKDVLLEFGNALPELGLMLRAAQRLAVLHQTLAGCRQDGPDETGCIGLLLVEGESHQLIDPVDRDAATGDR